MNYIKKNIFDTSYSRTDVLNTLALWVLAIFFIWYPISLLEYFSDEIFLSKAVSIVGFVLLIAVLLLRIFTRGLKFARPLVFVIFLLFLSFSLTLNIWVFVNIFSLFIAALFLSYLESDSLRKILYYVSVVYIIFMVLLILSINFVPEWHYLRDAYQSGGIRIRSSYGFLNANNATLVVYCMLSIFFILKKYFWVAFSVVLLFYFTSVTGTRSTVMVFISGAAYFFVVKYFYHKRWFPILNLSIFIFIITLGLTIFYATDLVNTFYMGLNEILTNRLDVYARAKNRIGFFGLIFGTSEELKFVENFWGSIGSTCGVLFVAYIVFLVIKAIWYESRVSSDFKNILTFQFSFLIYGLVEGLLSARLIVTVIFLWSIIFFKNIEILDLGKKHENHYI